MPEVAGFEGADVVVQRDRLGSANGLPVAKSCSVREAGDEQPGQRVDLDDDDQGDDHLDNVPWRLGATHARGDWLSEGEGAGAVMALVAGAAVAVMRPPFDGA